MKEKINPLSGEDLISLGLKLERLLNDPTARFFLLVKEYEGVSDNQIIEHNCSHAEVVATLERAKFRVLMEGFHE